MNDNILKNFPESQMLLDQAPGNFVLLKVNAHFHTPYSFSAFDEMAQVFEMANQEAVSILGINDFISMDGYPEFYQLSREHHKFPLFNIEFMGLLTDEQKQGIRVNDPNNPGRTYFSGKGLDYPVKLEGESLVKLQQVFTESMNQTRQMIEKVDLHLKSIDAGFEITFDEVQQRFAKKLVRERHIAKAIRTKIMEKFTAVPEVEAFLAKLYGKATAANVQDAAALDNEIRSNLLKSGGVAYVPEDPKAFLEIEEVIRIILDAGGIPCYPVLLDDKNGNFTEFEQDYGRLLERLDSLNVHCIELIPHRNHCKTLNEFVNYFYERGKVVLFGTEHNTPAQQPLTVTCEGDQQIGASLKKISFDGACVVAAHQYLRAKGETGYVDHQGNPVHDREKMALLGKSVIELFLNM